MKHAPTPIIWVCPKCEFMSKTKYWAHITPKIDDRSFDCNDDQGKPQEMIPYIPKSTVDELLEAAKTILSYITVGTIKFDCYQGIKNRIIGQLEKAIHKAEGKQCNQEQ